MRLGRRVFEHPNTQLTGLMTHLGRHSADPAVWATMARTFGSVVVQLADAWTPWRPLELDIGGGFPAPRDPTQSATDSPRRRSNALQRALPARC